MALESRPTLQTEQKYPQICNRQEPSVSFSNKR